MQAGKLTRTPGDGPTPGADRRGGGHPAATTAPPVAALLGLAATVALAGCPAELSGPQPAASGVTPAAVCHAQLTTEVAIAGQQLSPLPTETLTETPRLVLPTVRLTRVQDLAGAAAGGLAVTVPDDPADPTASHVRWVSDAELRFDVFPALGLGDGLYDLTVTNGNGSATTLAASLLAVPPPRVDAVTPDLICAEQDSTVVLSGALFVRFGASLPVVVFADGTTLAVDDLGGCAALPGSSGAEACSSATVTIPANTFDLTGLDYRNLGLRLTNPDSVACSSTDELTLTAVPRPRLDSLVPDLACLAQGGRGLLVSGAGFLSVAGVAPLVSFSDGSSAAPHLASSAVVADSCTPLIGPAAEVLLCSALTVSLADDELAAGLYDARVINPAPADCVSSEDRGYRVLAPPVLDELIPTAICLNQAAMPVTVRGAGFALIGTAVPVLELYEGDSLAFALPPDAASDMSGCTSLDGTTEAVVVCAEFTVTVPRDPSASGLSVYQARVRNPLPAGCASSEAVTLTRYPEPLIDAVSPTDLCKGGSTISILGSGFAPAPEIWLTDPDTGASVAGFDVFVSADGSSARVSFASLPIGPLDLTFRNAGGCRAERIAGVTVQDLGPLAFFADPPVLYNGISTQITIYARDLQAPVQASLVALDGGSETALTVDDADLDEIRAVVPAGMPAGVYSIYLQGSGALCTSAVLDRGLTIVAQATIDLLAVRPGFGWESSDTAVTIEASTNGAPFEDVPRLYLNPTGVGGTATALAAVTWLGPTTLTAIIPAGLPVDVYQLIVVNPSGEVGVSDLVPAELFEVTADPPPQITGISPGAVLNLADRQVLISGHNFRQPAVRLECTSPTGAVTYLDAATDLGGVGDTYFYALVDANVSASYQAFCVIRLTNRDNDTFDEFSALVITNNDQKLFPFEDGPSLTVGRRGLVAAAGRVSMAARYVYAIGGDNGTDAGSDAAIYDSVEAAAVDIHGRPGSFALLRNHLATGRSLASAVTIGRFVYVLGGTADGSSALVSVERAAILAPDERPVISDMDLTVVDTGGLGSGTWYYKVAALMPAADPFNPGGESLPSEAFVVSIPDLGDWDIEVSLGWQAVPGAIGYRLYRSPQADDPASSLRLIAELGAVTSFVDDGAVAQTLAPLRVGALGTWHTPAVDGGTDLLALVTARMGAGAAAASIDGATWHLYVTGGDTGSATLRSWERCTLRIEPDGSQTVLANFADGGDYTTVAKARWKHAAWWASPQTASYLGGAHWLYIGGGYGHNESSVNKEVLAAPIQPDGALGAFVELTLQMDSRAGYGALIANNFLYALGGKMGADPSPTARQALLDQGNVPQVEQWTSTEQQLRRPRYLMGTALESAFIYVLGGQTTTERATRSTEMTIW